MKMFRAILFFLFLNLNGMLAQNDTCLSTTNIGISFPPVTNSSYQAFSKMHLDVLHVKKIRFEENWWRREKLQGVYNWSPLDARINWAYDNHYEVLLSIQAKAPDWACSSFSDSLSCVFNDNSDFKNYLDTLLKRYAGKIDKIQFGNEWQVPYWYIGDSVQFVAANNVLYNSVKTNSPSTKVVLGGFTTFSLRALAVCNGKVPSIRDDKGVQYTSAQCGVPEVVSMFNRITYVLKNAKYDMLDLHLYDDVEQWDEYYNNFMDTITKPVLVSEFGGPNVLYETPYSDALQSNRLFQYIKKLDSLQIKEAYYFKMVEYGTAVDAHVRSGLLDTNLNIKLAYYLLERFNAGCVTNTKTVLQKSAISFSPNPMEISTLIEFNNDGHLELCLTICNSEGRIVRQISHLNGESFIFEKQDLSSGFYFVTLQEGEHIYARAKLIVY